MEDEPSGTVSNEPRFEVPVDWEALEDAFENNAPEVHSYLHLRTGEVLRVVDGVADPEMHVRISANATYLRVEPVSSREQYRWMERFILMMENDELKQKLAAAIDGKGAFRRFKDVLMTYNAERERWFAFRSERLRVFMEAWLAAHQVVGVARPEFAVSQGAEAATESALPTHEEPLRRSGTRGPERLRRELEEVTAGLGARELETVLTFAEFVRARRAAGGLEPRDEGVSTADGNLDVGLANASDHSAAEQLAPSSRKLSTVR